MEPQIDTSSLSSKELDALRDWRVLEVINRYNAEKNPGRAKELLQGLRTMLDVLAQTPPPIGPKNEKEKDLIGRVLSGVEYALNNPSVPY